MQDVIKAPSPRPDQPPAKQSAPVRTALAAGYDDLSRLRFDYPILLTDAASGAEALLPLTEIFNSCLRQIAPRGSAGEALRQRGLTLENAIRQLQAGQAPQRFSALLEQAVLSLQPSAENDPEYEDDLQKLRTSIKLDGLLVDCTADAPYALVQHLWVDIFARKMSETRSRINRLAQRMADFLRAAELASPQGRQPQSLQQAMGTSFRDAFDFDVMSSLMDNTTRRGDIPEARRHRIESTLGILRNQRLFADDPASVAEHWQFQHCKDAEVAFRTRMPELVELLRAIRVAELELEHRYSEVLHDNYFAEFSEDDLRLEDFANMPSLLVFCRNPDTLEQAAILQALDTNLPIKILVQHDDILSDLPLTAGKFSLGSHGAHLGRMALSLDSAFVLQTGNSHLFPARGDLYRGLASSTPSIFNVNAGVIEGAQPPYLMSAAAIESRAFPAYCYDPEGGKDWAHRFHLFANPQPERAWPCYTIQAEDHSLQRVDRDLSFTFADFASMDPRYAHHFAHTDLQSKQVVSVAQRLEDPDNALPAAVELLDADNRLFQGIVDDALLNATRRCAEAWRSLQELGGIHNSYAENLLSGIQESQQDTTAGQIESVAEPPGKVAESTAGEPAQAPEPAPAEPVTPTVTESDTDSKGSNNEAFIETPRCTTCEECVQINDRMFAYNENKQAYIADRSAGSYRELVEAAESCQVSIIHPGDPLDPNEPGLEELLERAKPFQ